MTPKQCKMARAALDWTMEELAKKAGLVRITIIRFEQEWHLEESETRAKLRSTLEKAGIEFIDDCGVHFPSTWNKQRPQQAA